MSLIQGNSTLTFDRKDHIWYKREKDFKCILCGGICRIRPFYPTPQEWMPDTYEKVTAKEKAMCRYKGERL
jgi:hypothetical protein